VSLVYANGSGYNVVEGFVSSFWGSPSRFDQTSETIAYEQSFVSPSRSRLEYYRLADRVTNIFLKIFFFQEVEIPVLTDGTTTKNILLWKMIDNIHAEAFLLLKLLCFSSLKEGSYIFVCFSFLFCLFKKLWKKIWCQE
jgi:hypothetical protein